MSGDLFGGGDPQPAGQQVVQQKSEPWEGQQPYLTTGFQRAQTDILNNPTQPYPNSTAVPFSPQTELALQATQSRALQGSPLQDAGQQAYLDTIKGNYLMADNPYLQSTIDAANRGTVRNFQTAVQPGIDSMMSKAGRYGSGQHFNQMEGAYNALGQQMSDTADKIAYDNYTQERGRQMTAAQGAPAYAAQDYNDMQKLLSVGQAYEGQAGAQLQDEMSRYYAEQQAKKDALADYMAIVAGGQYGGNRTTTTPIYSSGGGAGSVMGLSALMMPMMMGGGGGIPGSFTGGSPMTDSQWTNFLAMN
jgi:hypothetical protein